MASSSSGIITTKAAEILTVRPRPANRRQGLLTLGPITIPCALGRSGIGVQKREGDGKTPAGRFELLKVYYRPDRIRRPQTALPGEPLTPTMGWCDDPKHPHYNLPVELPFAAGHEKMWRDDHLYDVVVVLDCNLHPVERGRGSAIFFHLARPDYGPTEGCVAVSNLDMLKILSRCGSGSVMEIG